MKMVKRMDNKIIAIRGEYATAKFSLHVMEANKARAELRGDLAIVNAYVKQIHMQREMLARIERRLFKAMAEQTNE